MQTFELFTLNYPRFQPAMGVPVRTSNGYPRYVKYKMPHAVGEVMPARSTMRLTDQAEFTRLYRAKLDDHGLDVIASRLRAVAAAEGDTRLVLMCFEDLSKPGLWCHRTIFASWWQDMTGEKVRELGPTGPAEQPAGLFD